MPEHDMLYYGSTTDKKPRNIQCPHAFTLRAQWRTGHNAVLHYVAAQVNGVAILPCSHARVVGQYFYPQGGHAVHPSPEIFIYDHGRPDPITSDLVPKSADLLLCRNESLPTTWPGKQPGNGGPVFYLVRDLRNQYASARTKVAKYVNSNEKLDSLRSHWLSYVKEITSNPGTGIIYDFFHTQPEYRKNLVSRLYHRCGPVFKFTDLGRNIMPGMRSSFSDYLDPPNMDTTNRWKLCSDTPEYKYLITNDVLEALESLGIMDL